MAWKLAGYAKWAAKLLMTEMLVPGGTLLVLALLISGLSSPAMARKVRALVPFQRKECPLTHGGDLMASDALRRLEWASPRSEQT
jgi:hypothetical protein